MKEQFCDIEQVFPSFNTYIDAERRNRFQAAKMKKRWQDTATLFLRSAHLEPITEPVHLHFAWREESRRRDVDGVSAFAQKSIQDALVGENILPDDSQKWVKGHSHSYSVDRANPGVTVYLLPLDVAAERVKEMFEYGL